MLIPYNRFLPTGFLINSRYYLASIFAHSSEIFIHVIKVMFYNPTYFNPEILLRPLEESSPQTTILGFYQKKLYQ